jgi:hypothetical protein
MSLTELRDTLASVSDAVSVPAPDQLAFQRRVTRARRRRTTARALVAVGAVAAVTVGVAVLPHGGQDEPRLATPAPAAGYVPVVLQGELATLSFEGAVTPTGLSVQELLGRGDNGVAVLDPDGHLVVASIKDGDDLGVVRDLSGELVRGAAVSVDGRALGWVGQNLTMHLRGALNGYWTYDEASGAFSGELLLATDGTGWVELRDHTASLVMPQDKSAPEILDAGENARAAQMAGDTVAVQTRGGVSFFDLETGERRLLDLGGAVGGLSTDGAWYATSAGDWQRADGMSPDLNLVDTRTGETHILKGYDDSQQALSVWWADGDRFEVVTQAGHQRVLWDCSVAADRCHDGYTDPTGTLELPGQE